MFPPKRTKQEETQPQKETEQSRQSGMNNALTQNAGNQALRHLLEPTEPSADVQTLRGSGRPLPPQTATDMTQKFGRSFDDVRVHTDAAAKQSAASMGAKAYTVGSDIVFGEGHYAPETHIGQQLLAHELTHVLQNQNGRSSPDPISKPNSTAETEASQAATAVSLGHSFSVQSTAGGMVQRELDPNIERYLLALDRVRTRAVGPVKTEAIVADIAAALQGLDLSQNENLETVTIDIANSFPSDVLLIFLHYVESGIAQQRRQQPDDVARMLTIRPNIVGNRAPGIMIPVLNAVPRAVGESAINLTNNIGIFIHALMRGLSGKLKGSDVQGLTRKLLGASILNAVFPPVFLSGAIVSVTEDIASIPSEIRNLIENFDEITAVIQEMIGLMFRREGAQLAKAMGHGIGIDLAHGIRRLANLNVFEFLYELGKLAGPFLLSILISMALPGVAVITAATRIFKVLRKLMNRLPKLSRLIKRLRRAMPNRRRRRRGSVDSDVDADVERSFGETFDQTPSNQSPSTGNQTPTTGSTLTRAQIAAARRILGKKLSDVPALRRLWGQVANAGERATLTPGNSRRLFDNHRNRFWKAVRDDSEARAFFENAGFEFPSGRTTAPVHRGVSGRQGRISLDHDTRRADAPSRSLDADNLRMVVHGDNTLLENLQQAIPDINRFE